MSDIERDAYEIEEMVQYGASYSDIIDWLQKRDARTHLPAKVPGGYAKEKLTEALRQFRHNSDNTGSVDRPEQGFVFGYDKAIVDDLVALLTTPTPATTPETEWVKCAQTLPAKDHPFQCWYCPVPDSKSPIVVLTSARAVRNMFSTGNAPDARWMCSGINVPTPPQEQ